MLFTLGHGQHVLVEIVAGSGDAARALPPVGDVISLSAVVDDAGALHPPASNGTSGKNAARRLGPAAAPVVSGGHFAYYFTGAPPAPADADMAARLDALATAMVEPVSDPAASDSTIPPVFTYLGQFIDHDITANTDRETGPSQIDGPTILPLTRTEVVGAIFNLRNGALELDSVYSDGPVQGPFSQKLARLMRHPTLKGKMRLGVPTATDDRRPPLPADPAADLLRLGRLLGNDPATQISVAELQALAPALRQGFLGADGQPIVQKAVIGDARNDENLIVAQFHCAMLRFHNKVVDTVSMSGSSSQERFEKARRLVRWHYQWLVVNAYLPAICEPAMLAKVKTGQASLYRNFYQAHAVGSARQLPLPLEFSVAAFRFGHSMVRGAYDHNRFFGREEDGSSQIQSRAEFIQLFNFTGNGQPPMSPGGTVPSAPTLPNNWIIEWERLVRNGPAFPDRHARRIDTQLAPPLAELKNEPTGIFKHLAKRNLRRGHRLNIPAAQDCIRSINGTYGNGIVPLTHEELVSGPTGMAIEDGRLVEATPLWFYVLKEAQKAGGNHLGALGSVLVGETLLGLVIQDPNSYWHQSGSDGGRWHPKDGARPDGHVVDSIPALLQSVGLL
jgi:hypothetical protein